VEMLMLALAAIVFSAALPTG